MAKETKSDSKNQAASGNARLGDRRKERERESRRNGILITVGVIAAFIGLLVFGIWLGNRPVEAPIPEGAVARYEGLTMTTARDGFPRLGNPDAPVQVLIYSSFDCVECKPFIEGLLDPLIERMHANSVTATFIPLYGYGEISNGQGAARASMCAVEQGQFWPYMEALFHWQQFGNQAFTNSRILSGAEALGMDRGAFTACSLGGGPDGILLAARNQARDLQGFVIPPAVVINGVLLTAGDDNAVVTDPAAVIAAIDRSIENLARPNRTEPTAESTAEVTPEASEEATPEIDATAESTPSLEVTKELMQALEETPEATVEASS